MIRSLTRLVACAVAAATIAAGCSPGPTPRASVAPAGTEIATLPSATPGSSLVEPTATPPVSHEPTAASPEPASSPIARPVPSGLVALGDLPVPPARIPVLYYHRLQPLPADYATWSKAKRRSFTTYDTLPKVFGAQLDWLRDHGYTTILPRDLAAHWDDRSQLPARPVIITFDDGSRDWVTRVMPALKKRGMVAEFYLTLAAIEHGNLTWDEVRQLAAAGNGVGAHDVHHVQLTAFGTGRKPATAARMWAEVNGARQTIGDHIGVYPDSMAYVGGGYDATLQHLVEQAGYTTARGIGRGVVQTAHRRYALRVVRVAIRDDVSDLVAGTIVPGLPTFAARVAGLSDK
ncbi:MAG: polysaccharide deacetylase family protein [Chloroflexota bacterium]